MSKAIQRIKEHLAGGGPTTLRLCMIRRGLDFEIRTGMRMTNKAPKCSTILRKEFGLKGKPAKLLAQFEELLTAEGLEWAGKVPASTA